MSKTKEGAVRLFWGVTENIVANIIIVLAPILLGGLLVLYGRSPQVVLLWILIVLVSVNLLATLAVIRKQRTSSSRRSTAVLLREADRDALYLIDVHGRAREIPDVDSSSYLEQALGLGDEIPEISHQELAPLRGEKLPSIEDWKVPLTPEQRTMKDLKSDLQKSLDVTARFDEASKPQRILLEITSSAERDVHIKRIRFQHHELHRSALGPGHGRYGTYTIIPIDQQAANIPPRSGTMAWMQLAQIWQRSDIERTKGHWGFLILDVIYEGKSIDDILYSI